MKADNSRNGQRGVVLITTVILLILLTVLALTAVSMNSTQTRVAANSADNQVAYQTAEGAMNQAVNNLLAGSYPASGFASNGNGLYVFDPSTAPVWADGSIWSQSSKVISSFQGNAQSAAAYVIEQLPSVVRPGQDISMPMHVYRITARAVGASGRSPVILQNTVQVP